MIQLSSGSFQVRRSVVCKLKKKRRQREAFSKETGGKVQVSIPEKRRF
jgi:hypothetical protein